MVRDSSAHVIRALIVTWSVVLVLLNVAGIAFYVLWFVADDWASNRSEAAGGFDTAMLLPHGDLMWVAANATLFLILATDAVMTATVLTLRRPR
jgi:hypothetical protein